MLVGTADLLLGWWLGDAFRENSSRVAQLLALGMLVNIVAQVPLTALNAVGRADVSAKLAVIRAAALRRRHLARGDAASASRASRQCGRRAPRSTPSALFLVAHAVLPGTGAAAAARRMRRRSWCARSSRAPGCGAARIADTARGSAVVAALLVAALILGMARASRQLRPGKAQATMQPAADQPAR